MQVQLDLETPARLVFDDGARMSFAEFETFCLANRDVCAELTANGELILMPPAGFETSYDNIEFSGDLRQWAKRDKRRRRWLRYFVLAAERGGSRT